MSSSTNTVCKSRRALRIVLAGFVGTVCLAGLAFGQDADLRAPVAAVAGTAASIATSGSGSATFYLVGPSATEKRDVHLGEVISLSAKELQSAGKYLAIVCGGECHSVGFFVAPAKPVSLTFLVHPSRAPVGLNNVVSGVALPFDEFRNMVLSARDCGFSIEHKGFCPELAPFVDPEWRRLVSRQLRANGGRLAGISIDQ